MSCNYHINYCNGRKLWNEPDLEAGGAAATLGAAAEGDAFEILDMAGLGAGAAAAAGFKPVPFELPTSTPCLEKFSATKFSAFTKMYHHQASAS